MRILYVRNINQVAETDREEMVQRGHTVKVYEPNLVSGAAALPVKLSRMPERLLDLRHVIRDLHPNAFDIVHIHWASYGILGLTSRIPVILECHGSDVRYRLQNSFFRSILTPLFNKTSTTLCITPDILSCVQSILPDAIFMPGPVDIHRFTPTEDSQAKSVKPWTVLLFSRLDPLKSPEISILGIDRFAQKHPEVRIQLLDWGPLKEGYKKRYSNRFEFIPRVPPDEVQHLIQSADVVVGQFLVGALGLSELQAMSCAKPVITSFRYEEVYPASPPLCRADTPQEIEEHLEYLYEHQDKAIQIGQHARAWITAYHSCQVRAIRLEKLYQSILGTEWKRQPSLVGQVADPLPLRVPR